MAAAGEASGERASQRLSEMSFHRTLAHHEAENLSHSSPFDLHILPLRYLDAILGKSIRRPAKIFPESTVFTLDMKFII